MQETKKGGINYTGTQITLLVIVRLLIGWHLLYEGLVKFLNPDWTSLHYLLDSKGPLAWFFKSLTHNQNILEIIDLVNIWALMVIGLFLILGCFTRISAFSGVVLLALYYLSHPPLVGIEYAMPVGGNFIIVDKTLIEILTLSLFIVFPTGRIGLDRFLFKKWKRNY